MFKIIPWGDEESLYNLARETDSDLIISGHTHDMKTAKLDNKTLINPGSATGAYSPLKK
jgi:vacuolar protein sorting-associated protein 29